MAHNKSGQDVSRTITIEQAPTSEKQTDKQTTTSCNFENQTDNYKLQQANKFKSQQAQAPAPTSGTQNIQGDYGNIQGDNGKQANNYGNIQGDNGKQANNYGNIQGDNGKQANNYGNIQGDNGKQANNPAPNTSPTAPTSGIQNMQGNYGNIQGNGGTQANNYGTQNIQGDYDKQANNSGTQH